MIKKSGDKWKLYTKDGSRVLGNHSSKRRAKQQEIAIKISKRKRGED